MTYGCGELESLTNKCWAPNVIGLLEDEAILLVTKRTTADYKLRYNVESKSLISSEDAVKIKYPFEEKPRRGDDGIIIAGSCNGLICASHAGDIFYIWNPCTGENKVVRPPSGFQHRSFGFGYDSRTRDYKFVSVYCHPDRDVSQVEIYSLGSDTWENYRLYNPYIISVKHGVFLNGAVHWLANLRGEWRALSVIAMDMEDGEFKEIPPPKHMD
ncbi:F-box/kelch-repeat protein At3g06240-like [Papaver somniferum]|uniref:F-box/kelch-repeat protein At3g06240-like n=1 Tax=Papaver somniferum TaxID=3469 RepID=UPI000E7037C0|nr:F-box/kelch-repeat protein At3g06240-like [Papaver somniferum]